MMLRCIVKGNHLAKGILKRCTRQTSERCNSNLSYLHEPGCVPLQHCTVGDVLEKAANTWPDRAAVIDKYHNKTLNYVQLLQQADRLAVAFHERGLQHGDRIGIWAPNSADWILTYYAAARAGLISVCINPLYQKSEIEYCLNKVDVKALVMPEGYKTQQYYRMLTDIVPELKTCVAGKLRTRNLENLSTIILTGQSRIPGTFNLNEMISSADQSYNKIVQRNMSKIDPESGSNIQFTSGTTGTPKAALLSHKNIVNNGYFSGIRNELDTAHMKICVPVPLFHVYGVILSLMAACQHGATVVLPSPSYSPVATARTLLRENCEVIFGTPTMHVDLITQLRSMGAKSKARIAMTGGASCSPILLKNMKDIIGAQTVKSVYGLTETSAACYQSVPGEDPQKSLDTVGYLHDHLQAKVVDDKGDMVPYGVPGELWVKGYSIFSGYWEDPKTTAATLSDGWLKTGDQFVMFEDGYGNIVGRIKDIIIRGGENIHAKEIEDLINTHPDIIESQVFGVPDSRLGEEICAALRLKEGAHINDKVLTEFCEGKMAKFKIPRHVKVVIEYPKTTSGKVQKNKLRELFEAGQL